ncbi:MAG TPA: DnaJ domain-containing protein [Candidatus Limnocylindrales bacterium]|nr:DnaJ domain-containing protein [Candidatus Limnocylindrales bacterium]
MAERADAYKTLQVDPEADVEVIQAAYRRLAQKYHPDAAGPDGAGRMVAINEAWALLRNPTARAEYDRERAAANAAPPGPARTGAGAPPARDPQWGAARRHEPDTVSSDWTSGRSGSGSGYDPTTMRAREGLGAAGDPPGNASGTVLAFGRYAGWSLGEIARRDIEYVEWLERMPIGRPYREEIDGLLRAAGRRRSAPADSGPRRGLFRRR